MNEKAVRYRDYRGCKSRGGHFSNFKKGESQPKHISTRVYVGNLDYSTRSSALRGHMSAAGNIVQCEVLLQPSLRSKGCGIVEYSSIEEAQNAIDTLNDTELDGRPIFVREDRELDREIQKYDDTGDPKDHPHAGLKVFVGNLHFSVRWQDLKDFFSRCGPILHADVLMLQDGTSRGQGFVVFADREAAQKAIVYNGTSMRGREIVVREYSFR